MRWSFVALGAASTVFAVIATLVIASVGPRVVGYSSFVVYGGSMEPSIGRGSVAVGKPVDTGSLAVGDVIAYQAAGAQMPTLHRIVAINETGEERWFTTKGDANAEADASPLRLTGQGTRISYSVPYAGFLLHAVVTGLGRVAFVWLPGIVLLALVLWSVWRPSSRRSQPEREGGGAG